MNSFHNWHISSAGFKIQVVIALTSDSESQKLQVQRAHRPQQTQFIYINKLKEKYQNSFKKEPITTTKVAQRVIIVLMVVTYVEMKSP